MRRPLLTSVVLALLLGAGPFACVPPSRHADNVNNGRQPNGQPPPPQPTFVYNPPPPVTAAPPPPVTTPPPPVKPPPIIAIHPPARPPAPTTPPVATAPGCGEVDVDGVKVPLDCLTKDYVKLENASQALQRQAFAAAGTVPPDYVDHRRDKLEGPVRHQRTVGDGVAMAVAGAIDQALIRNGGGFSPVSALHLWMRAPRPHLGEVVSASIGKTITGESTLPYDESRACAWTTPEASRLCSAPHKGEKPKDDDLAKADAAPFAKLTDIVEIDGTNVDTLRATLAKNQDVLAVLRVDPDSWKAVVKSPDAEPLIPHYIGSGGVQTVALVGYAKQENSWYFLVKNSWGTSWGRDGYAWIQDTTLKRNVIEAYVVQAALASGAATGGTPSACAPGQVPDAVTKACSPPCPDNSPRTNNVCPDPKKSPCPPGFVNTTGACVVAAPDRSGSDTTTGVVYACGAAGCTYSWKRGQLGCNADLCSLSCPAPKFLAAVNPGKKTVTCTE